MMDHSFAAEQNQPVNTEKLGILAAFFSECKVGSLLNKSGISKTKGASPLAVFTIIFNLAFTGKKKPGSINFPPGYAGVDFQLGLDLERRSS